MSISSSISSAMSGLNAASRAVEVISNNIANATTEGYARRELVTSARAVGSAGQGVQVVGIRRDVNLVLLNERRGAEAGSEAEATRAEFHTAVEKAIGSADDGASIGNRIADFTTALIEASARPDSEARLTTLLSSAKALADRIGTAADKVQDLRSQADDSIGDAVTTLNSALARIAELNGQIRTNSGGGGDGSALMDQRQQLIDTVGRLIPVTEVTRENGQIALFTEAGTPLVDGPAASLGFTRAGLVTSDLSQGAGTLSGLTLNGQPIQTAGSSSPIRGGALAAMFEVRDSLGPEAQSQLDALARDLIERFEDSGVDPSLAPGDPGLFTDDGAALDPMDELGLAQRLAVNAAADPAAGGALWRLRDGLGAASAGDAAESSLLVSLHEALAAPRQPASGNFMTGARSFESLQSDLLSSVTTARVEAESEASYASARTEALRQQQEADGVDTDYELQSLLAVEQAYSANARVIQTISAMIDKLLEM